jgi:uncharacterized membrane protein HdeD (DUF308 family)
VSLSKKLKKIAATERDMHETQRWIFSLTPLGIAFLFYFLFLLPMDIPNKGLLYVIGGAAGFAGLQAYWIVRGWRRNEGLTIILGLLGVLFAAAVTTLYITYGR